jgi:hypothetical protein
MVIDYKGRVVGQHLYGAGSSYVAGTIDIGALRHFRTHAQWDNWTKDLRTELYQLVYADPIYPKNLYADRAPYNHSRVPRAGDRAQIRAMVRARRVGRSGLNRTRRGWSWRHDQAGGQDRFSSARAALARPGPWPTAARPGRVASCETVVICTCGASARRESS